MRKWGEIVIVFKCLREGSVYNVGASLYRLAAGRWDERCDGASGSLVLTILKLVDHTNGRILIEDRNFS
jgi:hypothetical protein